MAAAKGNTYSSKNNRLWSDTLRRACIQADGKKLRALADALIDKALDGDVSAIKEIGDRIGKRPAGIAQVPRQVDHGRHDKRHRQQEGGKPAPFLYRHG